MVNYTVKELRLFIKSIYSCSLVSVHLNRRAQQKRGSLFAAGISMSNLKLNDSAFSFDTFLYFYDLNKMQQINVEISVNKERFLFNQMQFKQYPFCSQCKGRIRTSKPNRHRSALRKMHAHYIIPLPVKENSSVPNLRDSTMYIFFNF